MTVRHAVSSSPRASSFDLSRLRDGIRPFKLHWFPRLGSTNSHSAVLRERGTLYAPAIVLTGRQTAGRGRGAHAWWSAGGCLTVTFVLPVDESIAPHQVPLLAGLAARRAAAAFAPANSIKLKWPNDLLAGDRKLAGLLCERVRKVDLIGIGLNVNLQPENAPPDLRDRITSLAQLAAAPLDLTAVLIRLAGELREVFHRLPEKPFATLLKEYDDHHALVGRRVTIHDAGDAQAITGVCVGLDDMGRLLVRDRKTTHRVIAGQVLTR